MNLFWNNSRWVLFSYDKQFSMILNWGAKTVHAPGKVYLIDFKKLEADKRQAEQTINRRTTSTHQSLSLNIHHVASKAIGKQNRSRTRSHKTLRVISTRSIYNLIRALVFVLVSHPSWHNSLCHHGLSYVPLPLQPHLLLLPCAILALSSIAKCNLYPALIVSHCHTQSQPQPFVSGQETSNQLSIALHNHDLPIVLYSTHLAQRKLYFLLPSASQSCPAPSRSPNAHFSIPCTWMTCCPATLPVQPQLSFFLNSLLMAFLHLSCNHLSVTSISTLVAATYIPNNAGGCITTSRDTHKHRDMKLTKFICSFPDKDHGYLISSTSFASIIFVMARNRIQPLLLNIITLLNGSMTSWEPHLTTQQHPHLLGLTVPSWETSLRSHPMHWTVADSFQGRSLRPWRSQSYTTTYPPTTLPTPHLTLSKLPCVSLFPLVFNLCMAPSWTNPLQISMPISWRPLGTSGSKISKLGLQISSSCSWPQMRPSHSFPSCTRTNHRQPQQQSCSQDCWGWCGIVHTSCWCSDHSLFRRSQVEYLSASPVELTSKPQKGNCYSTTMDDLMTNKPMGSTYPPPSSKNLSQADNRLAKFHILFWAYNPTTRIISPSKLTDTALKLSALGSA